MSEAILQWAILGGCVLICIVCELQHRTLKAGLKVMQEAIKQRNECLDLLDELLAERRPSVIKQAEDGK